VLASVDPWVANLGSWRSPQNMRRTPATATKTRQRAHEVMRPSEFIHAFCGLTISRSFPNYNRLPAISTDGCDAGALLPPSFAAKRYPRRASVSINLGFLALSPSAALISRSAAGDKQFVCP
jgi:hypothetical protein